VQCNPVHPPALPLGLTECEIEVLRRSRPDFTTTELRPLRNHPAVVERRANRSHLTPALLIHDENRAFGAFDRRI
jgi:hypothetical protein